VTPAVSHEWPDPDGQSKVRPYLDAPPVAASPAAEPRHAAGPDADQPAMTGLRPFVLSSGRVQSADPDIHLETQVTVRHGVTRVGAAAIAMLAPELQAIVALCHEPVSVAEISARLKLHLGVTKVLVGDLRAAGHLDVHTRDAVNPYDVDTIMRVIRGLRGIS
jgi:hypothetical protein